MKGKRTAKLLSVIIALMLAFPTQAAAAPVMPLYTIVGKDGWYFSDFDGSIGETYKGTNLFTASELDRIQTGFRIMQQKLSEKGIELVIFLAPNKERIYSEYMPDSYGQMPAVDRKLQLNQALAGEFRVVDSTEELMAAKYAWPQYDIYYKSDIHWNNIGAYVGAQKLLGELGMSLPGMEDIVITPGKVGLYYLEPVEDGETEYDISYDISFPGSDMGRMTDVSDEGKRYRYITDGSPSRKMFVIGDSFSVAMVPYLGQQFQDIYVHHVDVNANETLEAIFREKPSVVVFEVSERFFSPRMLNFADELIAGN